MLLQGLLLVCSILFASQISNYINRLQKVDQSEQITVVVWKVNENFSLNAVEHHQILEDSRNTSDNEWLRQVVTTLLKSDVNSNTPKSVEIHHGHQHKKSRIQSHEDSKVHHSHEANPERLHNKDYKSKFTGEKVINHDPDSIVEVIEDYKKYYNFKKILEVDYISNDKDVPLEGRKTPISKKCKKWRSCGKRVPMKMARKEHGMFQDSNIHQNVDSVYFYFQEFLKHSLPPYIYTLTMPILVILAAKIKTWLERRRLKLTSEYDTPCMDTVLRIVDDIQTEHHRLKSAMEQYAIDGNDKMRYVLLKIVTQQEQAHVTNKEYEENVVFRFDQCSKATMNKVTKLATEIKLERRISRTRRVVINKQIMEIRNQIKDLKRYLDNLHLHIPKRTS